METELEHILINSFKEDIISFLITHPEYYNEAIDLAISDKPKLSWRAAWVLQSCISENLA